MNEDSNRQRSELEEGSRQQRNRRQQQSVPRWIDEQLNSAMNAVESGAAIIAVARHFDILRSFLANHLEERTRTRKRGPVAVLNNDEEWALESYMLSMAEYGHPLITNQMCLKVVLNT